MFGFQEKTTITFLMVLYILVNWEITKMPLRVLILTASDSLLLLRTWEAWQERRKSLSGALQVTSLPSSQYATWQELVGNRGVVLR